MFIQNIKNTLIKALGGYTPKEQQRWEQQYQALLDSKTDNNCTTVVNEYIYRLLRDLVQYGRKDLYGQPLETWVNKCYNVLNNNMYRILIRYVNVGSSIIYKLDTTLDKPDEFKHVLEQDNNTEALDIINQDFT